MCAVEEIGKNSVSPSMIAMIMDWTVVILLKYKVELVKGK